MNTLEALKVLASELGYTVTPKDTVTGPEKFTVGQWIISKEKPEVPYRIAEIKASGSLLVDQIYANQTDYVAPVPVSTFDQWQPATVEQIKSHLVKLASEKGFKEGVNVKCLSNMCKQVEIVGNIDGSYDIREDDFWVQSKEIGVNICIYKAGVWAEIIAEPKPKSVFDLVPTTPNGQDWSKDAFDSNEIDADMAFSLLRQAIDKHNEGFEFLENGYYYPKRYMGSWIIDHYGSVTHFTPFRFPTYSQAESFMALEHAESLLKIALRIP